MNSPIGQASLDESEVAYQEPQPTGKVADVFAASVLDLDGGDPRE